MKVAPNFALYSEYVVIRVGMFTLPSTVGPTNAAPTVIGPAVIWDWSFSERKTPGLIRASAMFYKY